MSQRLAAHELLKSSAVDTKISENFLDERKTAGELGLTKTIVKVNDRGLLELRLTVSNDEGKLLEDYYEFIIQDTIEKN